MHGKPAVYGFQADLRWRACQQGLQSLRPNCLVRAGCSVWEWRLNCAESAVIPYSKGL